MWDFMGLRNGRARAVVQHGKGFIRPSCTRQVQGFNRPSCTHKGMGSTRQVARGSTRQGVQQAKLHTQVHGFNRPSCTHKGMGSTRQVAQVQEGKEILEPRTLTNSAAFKLDFPPVGVNLFPPVGSNSFPPVAGNSFPPVAPNSFPPVASPGESEASGQPRFPPGVPGTPGGN